MEEDKEVIEGYEEVDEHEQDLSRFKPRQQKFLTALEECGGIISAACQKAGIKSRNTIYEWMKNPDFKEEVEAVNEANVDYVESKLMTLIAQENPQAIFFYLKTKGKKRGYVETIENQITVNPFEELLRAMPDD